MTYILTVKETGNKASKFHYTVTDEAGNIISERKSNREYVACTIHGGHYFGRLDLIGKGDHGSYLKMMEGFGRDWINGKTVWTKKHEASTPEAIAYLKQN